MAAKKVGKPKADGARASEAPGPKADDVVIISIKARREWRDWANKIADAERASLATLVDQLLAIRARERGLPDPPPRGKE